MMYYIGKFFSQLYLNACEKRVLKKLAVPRTRKEVRIRAPFVVTHEELITIGLGTEFLKGVNIYIYPDRLQKGLPTPPHLVIGNHCYFGVRTKFWIGGDVTIGNNVVSANDVTFISENHGFDPESEIPYMDQDLSAAPVSVGDNCWIGEKVSIMPGVNIGKGCVIGAMSVVTQDVPDYSVVAGCPARVIKRYDFEEHVWKKV